MEKKKKKFGQVVKLEDEVEAIFTEKFTDKDRKKAMKFLKPQQPKDSHMITFFVGMEAKNP